MRRIAPAAFACAIAAAACAPHFSVKRDVGYTHSADTSVDVADVPVHGFPVSVDVQDGDALEGELLAAEAGALFVLVDGKTRSVDVSRVLKVTIELYDNGAVLIGLWTALGTASTLSHGFILVLSAPIWLATGIPATVTAARSGHVTTRELGLLYQYARFPQGLPPGWPGKRVPPPLPDRPPVEIATDAGAPPSAPDAATD